MKKFCGVAAFTVVLLVLSGCGGGSGSSTSPVPVVAAPTTVVQAPVVTWTLPPANADGYMAISGMPPNIHYVSLIVNGPNSIKLFSNYDGFDDHGRAWADLLMFFGNWSSVQGPLDVLALGGWYLRTSGVAQGASTKCYALLRMSNGYGGSTGYQPAWATSDAGCTNWKLQRFTTLPRNSNSSTLVVQEDGPAVVDHVHPERNRFIALDDGFGPKLAFTYSADGQDWSVVKHPDTGQIVEQWPTDGNPQFTTMVLTPFGCHAIGADWKDNAATRHIHIYSPDCQPGKFKVLEANAPTFISTGKGTALAYYEGVVHAVTAGMALSFPAKAF